MPSWAYWALFFVVSALAVLMAKRLDDRERRRGPGSSSAPPPDADQT